MALSDVAVHACISRAAARDTIKNMLRAGEIEPVGSDVRPHCKKPVAIYDLVTPDGPLAADKHDGGLMVLSGVMSAWR